MLNIYIIFKKAFKRILNKRSPGGKFRALVPAPGKTRLWSVPTPGPRLIIHFFNLCVIDTLNDEIQIIQLIFYRILR